jgi:hypothetical protein
MKAKLKITEVRQYEGSETLIFNADYSASQEDQSFAKATPSAQMEIVVTNPDLLGKFHAGESYTLTLTRCN